MKYYLFISTLASLTYSGSSLDESIFVTRPPEPRAVDASAFGAVGDGIHDDTTAIQRALNSTYSDGLPDCTTPGARVVFLQGDGRSYLLSSSLHMWMWNRIIGYGETRPLLFITESSILFTNASNLTPLIKVINSIPVRDADVTCAGSPTDGGNTAFGVGVMNVNILIPKNNPGAVGVRNRAAQGGILRSMLFTLASDAAAGVHSPGWSHQDLHFVGGQSGVLVYDTGAWPSIFRDCVFDAQSVAGIAWDRVSRDANPTSSWEGITIVRSIFSNSVSGVSASGIPSARITLIDSVFSNVQTIIQPPQLGLGNSSISIYNTNGIACPVLFAASDIAEEVLSPGSAFSSFSISSLIAGPQSMNVSTNNGLVAISLFTNASTSSLPPSLPISDTSIYPSPVSSWVSVTSQGLVGDGVTDNTNALNALLANAPPNSSFYFPLGVYSFSASVFIPEKGLSLFGLSCWDVVLTLSDLAPAFKNPNDLFPFITVGGDFNETNVAQTWIFGVNIRTGFSFGNPQPPPVPQDWTNPNPGALALLWKAVNGGGLQDVFFHPATWPDNRRVGNGTNTELSLVVDGEKTKGVFADLWSCNSYSMGGVRITNTRKINTFYQLSSEHHYGHELWITNASEVSVHTMQTEDRSPDAAPTASIIAEFGSVVHVTGLFAYYAADVPSLAAVISDSTSSVSVDVFRQYHSYHPMFFNCSFMVFASNGSIETCVNAKDFAHVSYKSSDYK